MLRGLRAATSQAFMDLARGQRWPAGAAGGEVRAARHMRVLDKPTLGEYTTAVVLDHAPLPALPGPITSDTQARALPPRASCNRGARSRTSNAPDAARGALRPPARVLAGPCGGPATRGAARCSCGEPAGAQAGAVAGAGGGGGYPTLQQPYPYRTASPASLQQRPGRRCGGRRWWWRRSRRRRRSPSSSTPRRRSTRACGPPTWTSARPHTRRRTAPAAWCGPRAARRPGFVAVLRRVCMLVVLPHLLTPRPCVPYCICWHVLAGA